MRKYTRDLYARLEAETGLATGLRRSASSRSPPTPTGSRSTGGSSAFNRLLRRRRARDLARARSSELFPLARTDDMLAGFYVAEDGRANPVDVTMSLAKGARHAGRDASSRACRSPACSTRARRGHRRAHRRTATSRPSTSSTAPACGRASSATQAGVNIPLQAAEHYYLITEPIAGRRRATGRCSRTRARYGYFREEGGGLMVGLFEPVCAPWKVDGVPDDFSFGEIPPDWDRMAPVPREGDGARARSRCEAGVRKFFCGPESFTPDLQPVVGEAPELRNYFVAAGLNSIGILTGGGIGRVAGALDRRRPARRRRHRHATSTGCTATRPTRSTARTRTVESLGMVYQCHYPTRSMQTARGAKLSPLHDRLAAQRRVLPDVSGWEGADWYAPAGVDAEVGDRCRGAGRTGSPYWAAEHRAAREGVILMDMSFMSKFLVQGRDAGRLLDRISRQRRRRRRRASSPTRSGSTRAARSRPTSPSPSSTTTGSGWSPPTPRTATSRPGCGAHIGDAHAVRHRRDVGLRAAQRPGPALARAAAVADHRRPVQRGVPVPRRARDRHRLRPRAVRPHHLPRRARLRALHPGRAGAARLRPARRGRARRSGCATPASRRWPACGWRRATATTATTSTTPTRCSRPGSASRSTSTKPGGFIGRDAVRRAEGAPAR